MPDSARLYDIAGLRCAPRIFVSAAEPTPATSSALSKITETRCDWGALAGHDRADRVRPACGSMVLG